MFSTDMGCGGNWLKKLTKLKKSNGGRKRRIKVSKNAKSNATVWKSDSTKSSNVFANATRDKNGNRWVFGRPIEDVAATKIQTSFRAFQARKRFRQVKGQQRMKTMLLAQDCSTTVQTLSALSHFQTYSKIHDQINARRLCMVIEGRLRQKRFENQLKVDAKLHEVERVWSSTPKSKDEIKTKIQIREEAAIKRERAMSYAFNHQWRANASQKQLMGNPELGKFDWGWSWTERWIAARPWQSPFVVTPNPTFKTNGKSSGTKWKLSNGKRVMKSQRRSFLPPSNKAAVKEDIGVEPDKSLEEEEPKTITSN